jgi:hypothetical protein
MNATQADVFLRYSREEKIAFLLRLAHELTIVARDTYEAGTEGVTNAPRLRMLNEIQHRILAFLIALCDEDSRRYPDEVLAAIVLDGGQDQGLQSQLKDAFDRAASLLNISS